MDTEMVSGTFGETLLDPLGLVAVLLLVLFAFFLDRRKAIVPLFIAAAAIPMSQRIVIFGADFTMLRILIVAYFARIMIRGEFRSIGWNRLDTAIMLWSISGTVVIVLAVGFEVLVYRFGQSFDMLGLYFVGRFLIRSWSDVKFVGKVLAVLSLPVAVLFAVEWATAYNMFSIFGGVRAETWVPSWGRLRCQGAFGHPILAGTFWAAALPLIWTLRKDKNLLMRLGTIGCLFIVAASSSSTPVVAVLVALTGVALFPWRRHRTKMWVGLFALLAWLHVVMKAPVWHLMSRVDLIGGSTGYHRYALFDAFVKNFSKWWLLGEPDPMSWGVWVMNDVTNVYVATGLTGGLLTLIVLLLVLIFAFGNVGRALKMSSIAGSPKRQWICWCIGVAICVHAVTFFGASYFGQIIVMLYLELALASCVYVFATRDARKQRAKNRVLEAQRPRNEILNERPIPSQSG